MVKAGFSHKNILGILVSSPRNFSVFTTIHIYEIDPTKRSNQPNPYQLFSSTQFMSRVSV